MILLIDNYDSFTYNLYQYLTQLGAEVTVRRNDQITISEIRTLPLKGIVISPGPGRPEDSGVSLDVIREMSGKLPILGVCLGHQAIGYIYGAKIVGAPTIMHGKISDIYHEDDELFSGMANPFPATRYHSLTIEPGSIPEKELMVTARTKDGVIMAIRHRIHKNLLGVQFHPESVMTQDGLRIMENFLKIVKNS